MNKELSIKKAKQDLSKVKCFNRDNNGHLTKDYPKPPWMNDYIAQSKLIFKGGFMAKIGAHKSEAFNLLKLNCKINNKTVGCLLDSRVTNSFMILKAVQQFRVKIELMEDPITVQLAQGIARPSLNIMSSLKPFCKGIPFFKNFTVCDLNNFDIIIRNTFLNAYKVNILRSGAKLKIRVKCGLSL